MIDWPDDLFWIPPFLRREKDPDAPTPRAMATGPVKHFIPLGQPITGSRGTTPHSYIEEETEEDDDA